jgi:hypothetical protein
MFKVALFFQRGIDKEFFLMFMRWYEQDGWYMDKSVKISKKHGKKVDTKSRQFRESNAMRGLYYSICVYLLDLLF